MTIDDYLNQMRTLRYKYLRLYEEAREVENKATNTGALLSLDNGVRSKSSENVAESRAIDAADAWRTMRQAYDRYCEYRDQLDDSMNMLLYWEGRLIYQVYIYNQIADKEDNLSGTNEILNTDNRKVILSKLNEAKLHLSEILISKGIEIESECSEAS